MADAASLTYRSAWGKERRRGPKARERNAIFERLAAATPAPQTELDYVNPYTLLVAVVLSAQATDAGVNKATKPLFAIADTPRKMVALGEAALIEHIKTIGLFRNKAKNVIALVAGADRAATAARFRATARRWRRCPGSAARPPMSCSTSRSASRRSPSTPMSSASPTGSASRPARRRARSRTA